jgi:hypothetical protein
MPVVFSFCVCDRYRPCRLKISFCANHWLNISNAKSSRDALVQGHSVFHFDANESQSALRLARHLTTGFGDVVIACRSQQADSRMA